MFPIGIFPWLMIIAATIFFDPSWMKSWFKKSSEERVLRATWLPLVIFCGFQLFIPLRHWLYPGNVNWTEEGFRFSWRVMLVEKSGTIEYEVRRDGQRFFVFPRKELPPFQYRMLATQPDMIHDYALELSRRFSRQDGDSIQVYARSFVWFNGRKSQQYIDPNVDLAAERKGFHHKTWIMPME